MEPGASDKNKAVGVCILSIQDKFVMLEVSFNKNAVDAWFAVEHCQTKKLVTVWPS